MFVSTHTFGRHYAGFRLTFANHWTISVQWGNGSYSDNHAKFGGFPGPSKTAEVAIFQPNGDWFRAWEHDDDVIGYQSPDDVARLIALVASK